MSERKEIFECECHVHQLVALRWTDEDELYLSMWSLGNKPWFGLRTRLRSAWRSLRRGDPYEDNVILSRDDGRRLGLWLLDASRDGANGNIGSITFGPTHTTYSGIPAPSGEDTDG